MKTPREKWVAALLPAIIVFGGYFWTYGRESFQALRSAQAELSRLQQSDSGPKFTALLAESQKLQDELEVEQARATQPRLSDATLPEINRTRTLQMLTGILSRHRLHLHGTKKIEASALSKNTATLARDLCAKASTTPQFWKLEFTGSYAQTLQALRDIGASRQMVVPAAIEMKSVDMEATERLWALTVWL